MISVFILGVFGYLGIKYVSEKMGEALKNEYSQLSAPVVGKPNPEGCSTAGLAAALIREGHEALQKKFGNRKYTNKEVYLAIVKYVQNHPGCLYDQLKNHITETYGVDSPNCCHFLKVLMDEEVIKRGGDQLTYQPPSPAGWAVNT
jgi:hypothetical protein